MERNEVLEKAYELEEKGLVSVYEEEEDEEIIVMVLEDCKKVDKFVSCIRGCCCEMYGEVHESFDFGVFFVTVMYPVD